MTRLFLITRSFGIAAGFGGLERATSDQARWLSQEGHKVIVISPTDLESALGVQVPWRTYRLVPNRLSFPLEYISWCRKVGRKLRDLAEEADVFYFHGASIFSAIFINKSIISKKIGVIVNPHGMEEFSAQKASMLFRAGLLRIMIRHGSKFANYALATDAALIPNVVKNLGVSESKVRVVVNAMEFESRSQPGTFQTKRFHSTVRRLTSVGRLEWNKGYDILASALVILSESDPEISLEWIHFGSGSQKKNIMTILEKSSNLNVTFFENSSDEQVKDTLSGADLFVQPSRSEGSSLTTLEALSQGILVVATRTGGIPDKVQDGRNGYLAEPGNLYSLIQTIKKALLQPPANYREESERIMVEKFSAKIAMMQFDDVLKAIKSSREA